MVLEVQLTENVSSCCIVYGSAPLAIMIRLLSLHIHEGKASVDGRLQYTMEQVYSLVLWPAASGVAFADCRPKRRYRPFVFRTGPSSVDEHEPARGVENVLCPIDMLQEAVSDSAASLMAGPVPASSGSVCETDVALKAAQRQQLRPPASMSDGCGSVFACWTDAIDFLCT